MKTALLLYPPPSPTILAQKPYLLYVKCKRTEATPQSTTFQQKILMVGHSCTDTRSAFRVMVTLCSGNYAKVVNIHTNIEIFGIIQTGTVFMQFRCFTVGQCFKPSLIQSHFD